MIARYVGLAQSAEQALADAFVVVGIRHAVEPEMRNAARLHSNWCHEHLSALAPAARRYGARRSADGERLRRGLFHGLRTSGFGLLRDLHDLRALAGFVQSCWVALGQGAAELRDDELRQVCERCTGDTQRHIDWLDTKIRHAAPQALTVPSRTRDELTGAIPTFADATALADRAPGALLRRLRPVSPLAGAALALGVLVLLVPAGGRRANGSGWRALGRRLS